MANALYDKGREGFLAGDIDWDAGPIKAALVRTAYSVNLNTHEFWSSVNTDLIGTPESLAGKTTTDGVADANDTTFPTVSGTAVSYVVIFNDTGTPGTSRLIAYIDTGTGLPVTPNGGDIIVVWDSGANRIFKL